MANSPAHRFGQVIGDLLEEMIEPVLQKFCDERGLYLDKKGKRGAARSGKKVSWKDKYGNSHDLDFVIERGGTAGERGRPLAFIETAWRRYTKHSRAKAQEIQAAVRPVADSHEWDKPFLGAVLAGVFTQGSLTQLRSNGFEVVLMPYEEVVRCFGKHGIDIAFDESTSDADFQRAADQIVGLLGAARDALKRDLLASNEKELEVFMSRLREVIERQLVQIIVVPLHGNENSFHSVEDAVKCIESYDESQMEEGEFRKYEIIVRYSIASAAGANEHQDTISAAFRDKARAVSFLQYIAQPLIKS